jgi:hypothetical protein
MVRPWLLEQTPHFLDQELALTLRGCTTPDVL